jgi:hypothetical protein
MAQITAATTGIIRLLEFNILVSNVYGQDLETPYMMMFANLDMLAGSFLILNTHMRHGRMQGVQVKRART